MSGPLPQLSGAEVVKAWRQRSCGGRALHTDGHQILTRKSPSPGFTVELAGGLEPAAREALETAFEALHSHLRGGFPPGAAAAVCDAAGVLGRAWGGWAKLPPRSRAVTPQTLFDLASLTKVLVTTPLCLRLARLGCWSLDDPVQRWLPGFRHPSVTLLHCLTHTSGLPAHVPFWKQVASPDGFEEGLFCVEPEAQPGRQVTYSDLNFMLLGLALESCAGEPLERAFKVHIAAPLGMTDSRFRPPATRRGTTAATEVWGVVHDENARFLGGVAGHAGLFATLDDVAAFARAVLAPDRGPDVAPFSPSDPGRPLAGAPPGEVRGLGWRLQPLPFAPGWPAGTIGHTGFTGTSILVAPGAGVAAVLLTNAVHPARRQGGAQDVRAAFHGALAGWVATRAGRGSAPPGEVAAGQ